MQSKGAVNCPALFELLDKYQNVRAVFNGHDHDEEGVKKKNNIPFVFDAHFGGSWGTPYHGFRVVELLNDNTVVTYMMNPVQKQEEIIFIECLMADLFIADFAPVRHQRFSLFSRKIGFSFFQECGSTFFGVFSVE